MSKPIRRVPWAFSIEVVGLVQLLTVLVIGPSAASAQPRWVDPLPEFLATRYPVMPALTLNDRPAVCERVLREWTARFRKPSGVLDLVTDPSLDGQKGNRWLGFERPASKEGVLGNDIVRVVHLEQDGRMMVLFRGTLSSMDRYEIHSMAAESVTIVDSTGASAETAEMFPSAPRVRALVEREGKEVITAWAQPYLFSEGGELYLHYRDRAAFSPTEPISVVRITADGALVEACRVEFAPVAGSKSGDGVSMPRFDAFVNGARPILGEQANCPISSAGRSTYFHETAFNENVWTVRNRPWAVPGVYVRRLRLDGSDDTLVRWSRTGLWEYRSFRALRQLRDAALSELAAHYVTSFGVPADDANRWALRMLEYTTESMVQPSSEPISYEYSEVDAKLLEGDPAVTLPSHYEESAAVPEWGSREPDLFFALEHPNLVEAILARGASVDEPNHFGKTALMYAAQFALTETARVLLRAGANPNLSTIQKPDYQCNLFERVGRTALMYAAENADEEMMSVLIENGADTSARDIVQDGFSPRRGIGDYLEHNSNLSVEQKQTIRQRWGF